MVIGMNGRETVGSYERARERQGEAAAERVAARTPERADHEATLARPGGIAKADTPARIAKRLARLNRRHPDRADETRIERIINTEDFVGVRYLEAGVAAARATGRINILDDRGRLQGYGTGSLVSPTLLLTNHHVLPDAETARSSVIEFDYQDGLDGRPLHPQVFELDPDRFFLASEERDCALVAVRAEAGALAGYGYNRLIEAEGKAIIGECVTIIQHPRGEKKQIALRENKIVDIPGQFLHYTADTEPGSSGSLAYNDQWEPVALHHASVPAPGRSDLGGFVNEGIRISRIVEFIRLQTLAGEARALADEIFAPPPLLPRPAVDDSPRAAAAEHSPAPNGAREMTISVPLEITVRIGANGQPASAAATTARPAAAAQPAPATPAATTAAATQAAPATPAATTAPATPAASTAPAVEAISIDPDYSTRGGYDPAFLARPLPLPALAPELAAVASDELRYHHFSVVMHRARALALYTAVNIDGTAARRPRRERDRWILDPRLPASEQTGEDVYRSNPLDRGHLVRRLDPAWGVDDTLAKAANDDTFHFTNASPQHHEFNAGQTLWAGLEDYVLDNADTADLAVSVLTGPVFADDDDEYRGVRLPRQFWKVVAMVKRSGDLSATGYLLSHAVLIDGLESAEEFSYGAYRTFQVPVRRIAELTGLGLEPHVAADPLERLESAPRPREIALPADLRL
jgi:endonuclease G, mitochondrial